MLSTTLGIDDIRIVNWEKLYQTKVISGIHDNNWGRFKASVVTQIKHKSNCTKVKKP